MSDRTKERESLCSCGRQQVELGCDLCAICRQEYEERQYERENAPWPDGGLPHGEHPNDY